MAATINASTSSGIVQTADTSGVLQLQTAGTAAITVDASQNVGIGTTSPSQKLSVNGNTSILGGNKLYLWNAANNSAPYLSSPTDNTIAFYDTSSTERMRIDSTGNVGVNTTTMFGKFNVSGGGLYSVGGGSSSGYFAVRGNNQTLPASDNGTDSTPNLAITVNYSNGSAEVDYFNCNNAGDGHHFYQKTGAAAATRIMLLSGGGNLTISGATATKATGTTWSNPSDQRLKDNIRDYTKGTTELMQVRVREWEYNGKGGTTEGMKGLGVVADEVMTVLPNTVETYDAKLNADDEETIAIKKFDATEITWLLVKTVQEQQTIINDLKARIEILEAK
jgi:hypothetical protein